MNFQLLKRYFFESEEKYYAWLLLIGCLLAIAGLAVLNAYFTAASMAFTTTLTEMNLPGFLACLKDFLYLSLAYCGISVVKDYLISALTIQWRNWFTKNFLDRYTKKNKYLDLSRHKSLGIDNPAARIQSDISLMLTQTISLGLDLLQNVLLLGTFLGVLWVVGGPLAFVAYGINVTIPGYLVWTAMLFSAVMNVLTHVIGKSLSRLTRELQKFEADFRKDTESVHQYAENIAQDRGHRYYSQLLLKRIFHIYKKSYEVLRVRMNLTAFKGLILQVTPIFPYVAAAPLYFSQKINMAQMMQVGYAFQQIQSSLSWFSNTYEWLAEYQASAKRVSQLDAALTASHPISTQRVRVNYLRSNQIAVQNLKLAYPEADKTYIFRGLSLSFKRGEHTVINGPSGLGKSTLFKAIAGAWKYGDGRVTLPRQQTLGFLPQDPVIPNDTLKAVLAYPDPDNTYIDRQYFQVLKDVGMTAYIDKLNQSNDWVSMLSRGQKQRISFARALLKKPDWLFLDEATASLDPRSEKEMYGLIGTHLPRTTMISIAHRPSVSDFHDRTIKLGRAGKINTLAIKSDTTRHPFFARATQGQRPVVKRHINRDFYHSAKNCN